MSELNNTPATDESIQDLGIPEINVTLSPSEVIQQATDSTLTAQGQPADAKAVGDRFAEVESDITDLGADIAGLSGAVLVTEQSLEPEAQAQARTNIGLGNASTYDVANDFATDAPGSKVLDAYQGKLLKDTVDGLNEGTVHVASQALTDAQKAQARANIDAAGAGSTVLTTEQNLTAAQQGQARTNIGAAGTNEAVLISEQSLTVAQQGQARTNIGAVGTGEAVLIGEQNLTTAQQAQARANIGAAADSSATLDGMWIRRSYSYAFTDLAAGSTLGISKSDFGIADIAGYEIMTVSRAYCSVANGAVTRIYATGDSVVLTIRNMNTSNALSGTATVDVIYIRTGLRAN